MKSFAEVHQALHRYVPPMRSMRGAYTLERMRALMDHLGNPQDSVKTIHVAGTSGKTSTSYYLAAFLEAAGQKTGLTISPHIDEVNERVQIGLKPMSEKRFADELGRFLRLVEKTDIKPTYFELLVAFAFWEFARQKVDYAVVEVGLGGLLDGTNVIHRADKVCVITDIGLDHTAVLGETLPAIATQKAGIIHPHNPVFAYEQDETVMAVLREVAEQLQAELHEVLPLKNMELPKNLPLYQRRNWYLAWSVYRYLAKRDHLPSLTETELAATTATHIPARMEIRQLKGKTLVFDGAHNAQKMQALATSMRYAYKGQRVAVLFNLVQSKKSRTVSALKELHKIADHLIITSFDVEQDLRKVSVEPLKVAQYCEELGFHDWEIIDDPKKAVGKLLKRPEDVLLITGSFYLLNHVRPLLLKYD